MFNLVPREKKKKRVKDELLYEEPYLMDKVVHTGKSDTEFYIITTVCYKKPVDSVKQLRSFDSDVGVDNILKKVKKSGENVDDVIRSGRFASKQPCDVDGTRIPRTIEERENKKNYLDANISRIWASLPEELKNHMALEDFCKKYDPKWLLKIGKRGAKKFEDKKEGK